MNRTMNRYLSMLRIGIMEELQFRMGAFIKLFGTIIYLIIIYFLWKAIFNSSPSPVVNGMTFSDTMIYLVLASSLFTTMEMYVTWEMGRSIQRGEIIVNLIKPMEYETFMFFTFGGSTIVSTCVTLIPTMIIVYLVTNGGFSLGINLVYFALAVLLGTILNFYINFIVGTICFYTESIWGVNIMKEVVVMLLSVASIPLAFFPEAFQNVVYNLPFQAIYNTPLLLLIKNDLGHGERIEMLINQLFWVIVVGLISHFFLRVSMRKITINGG